MGDAPSFWETFHLILLLGKAVGKWGSFPRQMTWGWLFIQKARPVVWSWGFRSNSVVCLHESAPVWGWGWWRYLLKHFFLFHQGRSLSGPDLVWSFSLASLLISSSGVSWNGLDFVCQVSLLSLWLLDPTTEGNIILGLGWGPWEALSSPGIASSSEGWALSFFSRIGDGHANASSFLYYIPVVSTLEDVGQLLEMFRSPWAWCRGFLCVTIRACKNRP